MNIPDHLYESEWANQSGSMLDRIHADEKGWLAFSDDFDYNRTPSSSGKLHPEWCRACGRDRGAGHNSGCKVARKEAAQMNDVTQPVDDYADPDTEPMPQLDEAIGLMQDVLPYAFLNDFCRGCNGSRFTGHRSGCPIADAHSWLAAKTNDERSDLPW